MTNYIPTKDGDFAVWARNLVATVAADPSVYGLTAADVTELQSGESNFDSSFNGMVQQRDAARAATNIKATSRKSFEEMIRDYTRQIQANPKVTDSLKLDAGLPVHDNQPSPIPMPANPPAAIIETPNVLENLIRLSDSAFPHRRRRPTGVLGCEIVGVVSDTEPTSMKEFHSMGLATRMNHVVTFDVTDGGKTVWYRFRWVGTRGQIGSWSIQYSASITK